MRAGFLYRLASVPAAVSALSHGWSAGRGTFLILTADVGFSGYSGHDCPKLARQLMRPRADMGARRTMNARHIAANIAKLSDLLHRRPGDSNRKADRLYILSYIDCKTSSWAKFLVGTVT